MASDICKEQIVEDYRRFVGVETKEADWKRRLKKKVDNDCVFRRFEHSSLGLVAFTYSYDDDEEPSVHEGGDLFYDIVEIPEEEQTEYGGKFMLMFTTQAQWKREECVPDQHWGHILEYGYNIPKSVIHDECMENCFIVQPKTFETKEDIVAELSKIEGVEYKPGMLNPSNFF